MRVSVTSYSTVMSFIDEIPNFLLRRPQHPPDSLYKSATPSVLLRYRWAASWKAENKGVTPRVEETCCWQLPSFFWFSSGQTMAAAAWVCVSALNDRKLGLLTVSFLTSGENPAAKGDEGSWAFFLSLMQEKWQRKKDSALLFSFYK